MYFVGLLLAFALYSSIRFDAFLSHCYMKPLANRFTTRKTDYSSYVLWETVAYNMYKNVSACYE